jgi:hypothetical protein
MLCTDAWVLPIHTLLPTPTVQIPRLYNVYKETGVIENFQQVRKYYSTARPDALRFCLTIDCIMWCPAVASSMHVLPGTWCTAAGSDMYHLRVVL